MRSRVVLNGFRNARIDAARLGELEALVTPPNGECVCCGSLRDLLRTLYDVPTEQGTGMFIEANGATETDALLGHLTTDRRLAHHTVPLQLTVIDAGRWQERWWHNALERAQVATATHLFLNWTERLGAARMQQVQAALHDLNVQATLVTPAEFTAWLADLTAEVKEAPRVVGTKASAPYRVSEGRSTRIRSAVSCCRYRPTSIGWPFTSSSRRCRRPWRGPRVWCAFAIGRARCSSGIASRSGARYVSIAHGRTTMPRRRRCSSAWRYRLRHWSRWCRSWCQPGKHERSDVRRYRTHRGCRCFSDLDEVGACVTRGKPAQLPQQRSPIGVGREHPEVGVGRNLAF